MRMKMISHVFHKKIQISWNFNFLDVSSLIIVLFSLTTKNGFISFRKIFQIVPTHPSFLLSYYWKLFVLCSYKKKYIIRKIDNIFQNNTRRQRNQSIWIGRRPYIHHRILISKAISFVMTQQIYTIKITEKIMGIYDSTFYVTFT